VDRLIYMVRHGGVFEPSVESERCYLWEMSQPSRQWSSGRLNGSWTTLPGKAYLVGDMATSMKSKFNRNFSSCALVPEASPRPSLEVRGTLTDNYLTKLSSLHGEQMKLMSSRRTFRAASMHKSGCCNIFKGNNTLRFLENPAPGANKIIPSMNHSQAISYNSPRLQIQIVIVSVQRPPQFYTQRPSWRWRGP
jgi:hypothetical protein